MNFNALKRLPPWEWPRNAGKIFLQVALNKTSPEDDRLLAVELAGDCTVMDDAMSLELLKLLCDSGEAENLRAKAATALGPILEYMEILDMEEDDMTISKAMFDHIQETLRSLHENRDIPKEIRRRCLEASVRSPQTWHAEAIRAAYLSQDEEEKLTSVFCMGYIDGFREELDQAMGDESPSLRNEALKALGNWQEDEPWFDVDDPSDPDFHGEEGLEDLLLLSGMKVPGLSGKGNLWKPPLDSKLESNDDVLDELYKTLTRGEMAWDDDIMGFNLDDDEDGES